jgi:plastocyanin
VKSISAGPIILAGLLLGGSAVIVAAAQGTHTTYTITIENMQFTPQNLSVHPGDQVVFVNKDLFAHTATANDKAFDSHEIAANASWKYQAGKPGEYAYGCTYHPTMKGKVTVQ